MPSISPVSSTRFSSLNSGVLNQMGLLAELNGTWEGRGFNLIARPDFAGQQNLYLQLNQTVETLRVIPIGSPIPNRGFGQTDIELFGLHYLQQISDAATGGALHIEPGLWVTEPQPTTYPNQDAGAGAQLVTRMGSIPHGNAILAQGTASSFSGPPVVAGPNSPYAFSVFPSFNSTPFGIPNPPGTSGINAAGSSEELTAPALQPPAAPFQEYDISIAAGPGNPRSPFDTSPPDPPLPDPLEGVPLQGVVNDPISLLQKVVQNQVAQGYTFTGTVLNIATQANITFLDNKNDPTGPSTDVAVPQGFGGVENILFLLGGNPSGAQGPNAQTALVYATFWIEQLSHPTFPSFLQLQYAQMVQLNFGIFSVLNPPAPAPPGAGHLVELGWPHITVGTLRKPFS
jgi:hypothetical protein